MSGTITQSIQFGVNNPLSQEGMSYKARFKKANGDYIQANYGNVIDRYLPLLKQHIIPWTMLDEDYQKYIYQPKKMSNFLYGTVELWPVLMSINQIYSITDFNKQTVNILSEEGLELIQEILIKESDNLSVISEIK